ncbi:MAG: polyphosphate:AMP phosphotransferase [Pseudomonadales bacterium]|nr:polyphosphate:AMP phosphotransferase [Halioglobus sp.]MCP5123163.1 polyphosphate:AMP phosphotransferase [Pseudomonadales bacterium]MCP5192808.1 polyphosphate:AMP phosphotransferase [Pseudomonadales bacterium]
MFETLEVGKQIKGSDFNELQQQLRERLLMAQLDLAGRDYPVIIVVAGLDGAGKGSLVQQLNEWMDPRWIETNTFWEHSDEEESRPYFWRFWRSLPARGQIGIFLGSWYTRPAQAAVGEEMGQEEFALYCKQIESFERLLTDDGALVIKLWLHISHDTQQARLQDDSPHRKSMPRSSDHPYELRGKYNRTLEVSEQLILATDSSHSPWQLLEAEDRYYRDITAGELILEAMLYRAGKEPAAAPPHIPATELVTGPQPTVLNSVDLALDLKGDEYREKLEHCQAQLRDLGWLAYQQKRSVVAVFEGWDAAGKGSAIRRVTRAIDPRLFRLVQFSAPTDEERAHHYLWRFWRQLQRDGRCTFYDRSWYGRVLVERVEQFAAPAEWQRAYSEINRFERQLVEHGIILLKFWIHISKEEQEKRFLARQNTAHKQHKLTDDDWRNREKWHEYELAVDQMVSRTSTHHAPWTLVAGNSKPYARIQILETFCRTIGSALEA